ncbi:hypothetical protein ACGF07_22925 [Kitasatospora sp. NPDC048194]|uniref:hypothetical protein n=1 Tax=Kitasatospora sp. NPDC048194 TaxID=3364045 RepID=UPI00371C9BEC
MTLRDRPLTNHHRGRITRYLDIRFALPIPAQNDPKERRRAPVLTGPGLRIERVPDQKPWRLPLSDMADVISASFVDLVKVVIAESCGVERTGLIDLLYGRDRICESIDALTYGLHDLQLRKEEHIRAGQEEDPVIKQWDDQANNVRRRLNEANAELKRQRLTELNRYGLVPSNTTPTDDPIRFAKGLLGDFLRDERAALMAQAATAAGLSPRASVQVSNQLEKIHWCIERGLLKAPVTPEVSTVLDLDDARFRLRVLQDAGRQQGRDDALCHPLVLHRWQDQLEALRKHLAADAQNPSHQALVPLSRTTAQRSQPDIAARRRLFASLVQRTNENSRLKQTLFDSTTIAERCDPEHEALMQFVQPTYEELVRRHPDLFRLIREMTAPHETRYGRFIGCDPWERRSLRKEIINRLRQHQEAKTTH